MSMNHLQRRAVARSAIRLSGVRLIV